MDEIAHTLIQQEEEDEEGDLEQGLQQSAALAAVALMVIANWGGGVLQVARRMQTTKLTVSLSATASSKSS